MPDGSDVRLWMHRRDTLWSRASMIRHITIDTSIATRPITANNLSATIESDGDVAFSWRIPAGQPHDLNLNTLHLESLAGGAHDTDVIFANSDTDVNLTETLGNVESGTWRWWVSHRSNHGISATEPQTLIVP